MNLINDPWIPVRRQSGAAEKIAPYQLTDRYEQDPIIELAAVRPDFNGALIQFLIGLLQTTSAPQSNRDWRRWYNNHPSSDELKARFSTVGHAFNFDGEGPRFMQDFSLSSKAKKTGIEKLLIDCPGDNAIKGNKDLFIKRDSIKQLCLVCSAQALLTLQINAPSGGQGHRVGLRGGGPLNTIICTDTLWKTVWCNVLLESEFNILATHELQSIADRFPWLAETKTSENDKATTSQDAHPAQIYWSMPRRIRLQFIDKIGKCDLCHNEDLIVEQYLTKGYGVKYEGFIHPLTPTYKNKDGFILPVHQHESINYKHWLGYVQNSKEDDRNPALVARAVFNRRLTEFRLWGFGYDMDNMKACCWYEGMMPVNLIEDQEKWELYSAHVVVLIHAANEISEVLSKSISRALNRSVFDKVRARFWQETESEYYHQIALLYDDIIRGGDGLGIRQSWHRYLAREALDIFNDMSQADLIELVNAKRVAKAWNELQKSVHGKKIKQEIMGLS